MSVDYSTYTAILDRNAEHFGVDRSRLMDITGEGIARELLQKYGEAKSYAFLCGLGYGGGSGMAAARWLRNLGVESVSVYLIGRASKIISAAASEQWRNLPGVNKHQDCYSENIQNHEIICECLTDTGQAGKLTKRIREVIKRVTHFRQKLVAVDTPAPGYTWDLALSTQYPKTTDAIVINVAMPPHIETGIGPGHVEALFKPKRTSYKSLNGKLLTFNASKESIDAAKSYAVEVLEYSRGTDLENTLNKVDSVLIGAEYEPTFENVAVLNAMLKNFPKKNYVIASAISGTVDFNQITADGNILFVLNRTNIAKLFNKNPKQSQEHLVGNLRSFASKNSCYVLLEGIKNLLFGMNPYLNRFEVLSNDLGVTDDKLLGLAAAYSTKNNLWLSAAASSFGGTR